MVDSCQVPMNDHLASMLSKILSSKIVIMITVAPQKIDHKQKKQNKYILINNDTPSSNLLRSNILST